MATILVFERVSTLVEQHKLTIADSKGHVGDAIWIDGDFLAELSSLQKALNEMWQYQMRTEPLGEILRQIADGVGMGEI